MLEASLHAQGFSSIAAMDEVGRGALCGPVTVGVVVVTASCGRPPAGLRDSKLLTPSARQLLVPRIQRWASAFAIGHATPAEIDDRGLTDALRLAGHRALGALCVVPDCILLDGRHDYLTPQRSAPCGTADPAVSPLGKERPEHLGDVGALLLSHAQVSVGLQTSGLSPLSPSSLPTLPFPPDSFPRVHTQVRADEHCASVAAASVLAKTTRDALMVALAKDDPRYDWEVNKGYATKAHRAAIAAHGPTPHHRRSWRVFEELAAREFDSSALQTTEVDLADEQANVAVAPHDLGTVPPARLA